MAVPVGDSSVTNVVQLEEGRPHVWVIDVDDGAFLALGEEGSSGESLWTDQDRARAAAFLDPLAGRRLLARRAATRMVLAGYAGCDPCEIRVVTAPGGKPVSVPNGSAGGPAPAFSVGHSGSLFCIGIARGSSVGCDIEKLRSIPRARAIAERWFGPEEAASLVGEAEALDLAFMDLWTCKESLAKRHGAGLRLMMGQAGESSVRGELDVAAERTAGRLQSFEPQEGYLGAIASSGRIDGIELVRPRVETWTT